MSQRLRHFMTHPSRFAFLLLAIGCSGGQWAPRRIDLPPPFEPSGVVFEPSYVVWIWSAGKVEKWHAVVITLDSVSGIPYRMALQSDTCRRSMPRAQVDSMTLGHETRAPNVLLLAGVVAAVIGLEMVICSAIGPKNCWH